MAELIKLLRVFVSSPNDLKEERRIVERVVSQHNQLLNNSSQQIRLEPISWETHAYPGFGADPQSVINEQLDEYDIFLGMMGFYFGTPTARANSGTEEEFNRAYEKHLSDPGQIRILFYFKNPGAPPDDADPDQLRLVNDFRARLQKTGLFWTYEDAEELRELVTRHLHQHLNDFEKTWGIDTSRSPVSESGRAQSGAGSAGITVRSSKRVFARHAAEVRDEQRSFVIREPIIEGDIPEEVLGKVYSLLSYERVFDLSLKDEMEEGWGLSSLDFEVNYLGHPFLDVTLTEQGVSAYPWEHNANIVVNLETGERVKAADLFKESSHGLLASRVNELVQFDLQAVREENFADETSGWFDSTYGRREFRVEDLDHFSINDGGVTFLFDFDFIHAMKALEPEGRYFFSHSTLKPFIKPDGLLRTRNHE